jgi:hypothetical protein
MTHYKHMHFFLFEPILVQPWMGHIPRCQVSLGEFLLLCSLQYSYLLQNIILLWPLPKIAVLLAWHFFAWLSYQNYTFIGEYYKLSNTLVDFSISVPFYLISVILAYCLLLLLPLLFPHFILNVCIQQIWKKERKLLDYQFISITCTFLLSLLSISFFLPSLFIHFFSPSILAPFPLSYSLSFLLDWFLCHCLYFLLGIYEQESMITFSLHVRFLWQYNVFPKLILKYSHPLFESPV